MSETDGEAVAGALHDEQATDGLGGVLAQSLKPGDFVALKGELGSGKSHLARAVIRQRLAQEGRVEETPSPTYTLVQSYDTLSGPIRHADLYRLAGSEEVEEIGLLEDADSAILLVEWPDRLGPFTPERRLEVLLEVASPQTPNRRLVRVKAFGEGWRETLAAIKATIDPLGE